MSDLVGDPEDHFSHVGAHNVNVFCCSFRVKYLKMKSYELSQDPTIWVTDQVPHKLETLNISRRGIACSV